MTRLTFALLLLLSFGASAFAHTDEYFDKTPGPHHGRMRMSGPYHLELVTGQDEVTLYVTDHAGTPIDTTGGSAKVIITAGKKKRFVVVLSSAGENVLKGEDEFKLAKGSVANVLVALPGQEPQRAQFPLSAPATRKKHRH